MDEIEKDEKYYLERICVWVVVIAVMLTGVSGFIIGVLLARL